jgi:hypothetical protein
MLSREISVEDEITQLVHDRELKALVAAMKVALVAASPFLAGQACSLELCQADSIGFRLVVAAQGPATMPSQPNRRIAESPRRSFWPNRRIARPCSAIRRDSDNPAVSLSFSLPLAHMSAPAVMWQPSWARGKCAAGHAGTWGA